MQIQTMSVVVGTPACNAKCPFCISRMTGKSSTFFSEVYNWRNLDKACRFAEKNGVSTALITGKGEPTLSEDIFDVCSVLNKYFPFIELQTNGSELDENMLNKFYDEGLSTVILSMVHYDNNKNNKIYGHRELVDIEKTINRIHSNGLSVRLSCIMLKGYIDSTKEINNLVTFCKKNEVEQLTIRSVDVPAEKTQSKDYFKVREWTSKNIISPMMLSKIFSDIKSIGTPIQKLVHGAVVFDYMGQNLCVSNCLTRDPESPIIRQIIVYPNGHIYYDWAYSGAIML